MSIPDATSLLPALLQSYGWQSWTIDHGQSRAWAETFTPDGVFDSPTYGRVHRGHDELTAFAAAFAAGNQGETRLRHIISNVFVSLVEDVSVTTRAHLSMVASTGDEPATIRRLVELEDTWSLDTHPLLRYRRVSKV